MTDEIKALEAKVATAMKDGDQEEIAAAQALLDSMRNSANPPKPKKKPKARK